MAIGPGNDFFLDMQLFCEASLVNVSEGCLASSSMILKYTTVIYETRNSDKGVSCRGIKLIIAKKFFAGRY